MKYEIQLKPQKTLEKVLCEKSNFLIYTISLVIICLLLLVVISISCYYYYARDWIERNTHYCILCKMNGLKEIDIKNRTYYFFDDMINIKNLGLKKIKVDENSHKNILVSYIGYVTVKNLSYAKINSVNHLYFMVDKINGYIK